MTWEDVLALVADLPEVTPSTSYGTPALKVRGKLLTRLKPEEASLVLFEVPLEERAMLIEAWPAIFHATPHYDGYPIVLARLGTVEPDRVRGFLFRRWRSLASKRAIARFEAAS